MAEPATTLPSDRYRVRFNRDFFATHAAKIRVAAGDFSRRQSLPDDVFADDCRALKRNREKNLGSP
jgi:hypothetical protein